jgi:hypothetical protein
MLRTTSLLLALGALSSAGCLTPDETSTPDIDEEIDEASSAISNGARWVEIFGNGFDSLALPNVATDGARNAILAGNFSGAHDIGDTPVAGTAETNGVVVKLDRDGAVKWVKTPTATGDVHVTAVTADLAGNVYVTGVFDGEVDWGGGVLTSAGDDDFFVAKLGKNGAFKWAKRFGGAERDWSSAIAVDLYGGLAIGFSSYGELDLGGGAHGCASCGGQPIQWGGFAVLDVAGNYLFEGSLESDTDMGGASVAFGYWGDLWVSSTFEGTALVNGQSFPNAGVTDVVLAHYDFFGEPLSAQAFGGPGYDWETSVAARPNGGAVLTGSLGATANFGGDDLVVVPPFPDQFVLAVDFDGAHDFSFSIGSPDADAPGGIAVDLWGNIAVTGALGGVADLGDGPIGTTGFFPTGYVAKYDWSGALLWTEAAVPVPSPDPFAFNYSAFGHVAFDVWSGDLVTAATFSGGFDFAGTQGSTVGPFGAESTAVARLRP